MRYFYKLTRKETTFVGCQSPLQIADIFLKLASGSHTTFSNCKLWFGLLWNLKVEVSNPTLPPTPLIYLFNFGLIYFIPALSNVKFRCFYVFLFTKYFHEMTGTLTILHNVQQN